MKPILLFLLTLTFALTLYGQGVIALGKGQPTMLSKAEWYLDTLNRISYHFEENNWKLKDQHDSLVIVAFENLLLLKFAKHCPILQSSCNCLILTNSGRRLKAGRSFQIRDSLVSLIPAHAFMRYYFHDSAFAGMNWFAGDETMIVDGLPAFCVTSYDVVREIQYGPQVHGWGMLGTNGKWLIEPKFDQPFRFQNGFAEVLYYGQKRKINEKGEFVE
jgi:hypothetical protein